MTGRKPFLIVMFAFLLVVSAAAQVGEIVFESPWGEGPGKSGIVNKPEMEVRGPLTFCADGQNIFILDSVRKQIVRVNSSGETAIVAKNMLGWSLCSDGKGGVFVQAADQVKYLNADGKKSGSYKLKNRPGETPKLIEGYGNDLFAAPDGQLKLRSVTQKVYSVDDAPGIKMTEQFKSPSARLNYAIKRMEGNEVRILGKDADGKVLVSVPVKIDNGKPGAAIFKGVDKNSNLYVELEILNEDGIGLEVHRYSPDGKQLAVFPLSNDYYTTVYKKTDVAPDGSVYQMLTTSDGVRILRYGKEM